MPLKSMTGFARGEGSSAASGWQWEVRSVNGKGLDVRLRLPPGCDTLEPRIRDLTAKRLTRGSVNIALNLTRDAGGTVIRLNEQALMQVGAAAKRAAELVSAAPVTLDGLLALRGVLETAEPVETEAVETERRTAMLDSLAATLDALAADRAREGERLARLFAAQIDEIEALTKTAAASPERKPERIAARLKDQLERLGAGLDKDRLYQEAALLAVKADIEEEVQRLASHVEEARRLLTASEPVGRKLDFLTQEFFREANTLCSKAIDIEVTRIGLKLKAVVDQLREQVQNIE